MMSKNLLVIGGSSLIGQRFRAIANSYPGTVTFTGLSRTLPGDLILDARHPELFSTAFRIDDVIMCAPIWLITEALIRRLHMLGMRRLVAFSSTSILTKTKTTDQNERAMLSRLQESEERVRRVSKALGVDWTILRPTMIYDEGHDRNVTKIMRVIQRLGFFPVAGDASGLRRPVHAMDLANGALAALRSEAAVGKTYNLSGGEVLTYSDMVGRIFLGMKRSPRIVSIPLTFWRLGFFAKSLVRPGSGTNFEMARRMSKDMDFSHDEAANDFGFAPRPFRPRFDDRSSQA